MKEIIKPAVVLFVITAVAGLLLGFVSEKTKAAIDAQNEKTKNLAMQEVMPEATSFEDLDFTPENGITTVSEAYKNDEKIGNVMRVDGNGFGGTVSVMIGISSDGTLTGVKVVSHSETPGLGARSTEPAFYEQFIGKADFPLSVIKNGTAGDGEIMAITSATITSKAVTECVNTAYNWLSENGGAD